VQVASFSVLNDWYDGDVTWSIPALSMSNTTELNYTGKTWVFVEYNDTTQGMQELFINASRDVYVDALRDQYSVSPLHFAPYEALYASGQTAVYELAVNNSLDYNQTFSWRVDTGEENITSTGLAEVEDSAFVYVEAGYGDSGAYRSSAVINSSQYNDTDSEVVLV